ncbi:MAG: hypothetical protein KatS3mg108_3283 [Isosphaeraceae bacterium]|jgi:hypothetical protein|nr:MAG: hypothetical protein KatS3mg108_3283 [Isosphaeraceae bacterium]
MMGSVLGWVLGALVGATAGGAIGEPVRFGDAESWGGVGLGQEAAAEADGSRERRELNDAASAEVRLRVAERLLERAGELLERGEPKRAMAMIALARRVLRMEAASTEGQMADAPSLEVGAGANADRPAAPQRRGTLRVEIRQRTRNPDGTVNDQVVVREYAIGPGGLTRIEPQPDPAPSRAGRGQAGLLSAIRQLERLTRGLEGVEKPQEQIKPEAAEPEQERGAEAGAESGSSQESTERSGGNVVGIGLLLEKQEGGFVVRGVLEGSPAAREGSIREGDRLVGIVDEDGSEVRLEDQSLEEVVKMIRGEPGTTVRLIVQAEGSDERREVVLERQELRLP